MFRVFSLSFSSCMFYASVCLATFENVYANNAIASISEAEIKATKKYTNASAVVLKKITKIEVDSNFLETVTTYRAIKLNSQDSIRDYGQMTIGYDSFYEDAELDFANTISTDGKRQPIDKKAIQIQTPPSPFFYTDRKEIVFSLSSLQPGAVIELQYTKRSKKIRVENHWSSRLIFYSWQKFQNGRGYRLDPVNYAEYEISLPKELLISDKIYNSDRTFNRQVKTTANKRIYTWKVADLDEFILESGMPHYDQLMPHIVLTSMQNWNDVNQWAWGLFESQRISAPELTVLAQELSSGKQSDLEKIKAVYEYIQGNIRYLYSHVGRGGYTPHQPLHVIKNGYGDCKDQTMLTVALLNEMGIKASPALVTTRNAGVFDPDKKLLQFNHMIVYLPEVKHGVKWIDTTSEGALFPGNLSPIENVDALVLSDGNAQFVRIPESTAQANHLKLSLDFKDVNVDTIKGSISLSFKGALEEAYRAIWQRNKEKEQFLISFIKRLYPRAEVTNIVGHNVNDYFSPFHLSADIEFKKNWVGDPEPFVTGISFPYLWKIVFMPDAILSPSERRLPIEMGKNYSLDMELSVTKPADNYFLTIESSGSSLTSDFYTIKQAHAEKDDRVTVTASSSFKKGTFGDKEYAAWYEAQNKFINSPAWVLRYIKDDSKARQQELEVSQESSIESMNDLIQLHLDNGKFELALSKSEEAVIRQDKNGRTYYLRGLSQAYMDMIDESNKSFKLAEQQGYKF